MTYGVIKHHVTYELWSHSLKCVNYKKYRKILHDITFRETTGNTVPVYRFGSVGQDTLLFLWELCEVSLCSHVYVMKVRLLTLITFVHLKTYWQFLSHLFNRYKNYQPRRKIENKQWYKKHWNDSQISKPIIPYSSVLESRNMIKTHQFKVLQLCYSLQSAILL